MKVKTKLVPFWYESEKSKTARFELKPLTGSQAAQCLSNGVDYSDILRFGLVDWKGVEDENGELLPCNNVNKQYLPAVLIVDIGDEIIKASHITEQDEKNS